MDKGLQRFFVFHHAGLEIDKFSLGVRAHVVVPAGRGNGNLHEMSHAHPRTPWTLSRWCSMARGERKRFPWKALALPGLQEPRLRWPSSQEQKASPEPNVPVHWLQ